jgi:hypothetical protein
VDFTIRQKDQAEEDEMGGACSTNGDEEIICEKVAGKETSRKTKTWMSDHIVTYQVGFRE